MRETRVASKACQCSGQSEKPASVPSPSPSPDPDEVGEADEVKGEFDTDCDVVGV